MQGAVVGSWGTSAGCAPLSGSLGTELSHGGRGGGGVS